MPTLSQVELDSEIKNWPPITDVWIALGGDPPRRGRARAFWRDTSDLNVSLNDPKGVWHDWARGEGGGVLDLVQHVRGGDRGDAYRWLAERFGLALRSETATPAERADYARRRRAAEREARPLARLALWFVWARMAELSDAKADAIDVAGEHIDVEMLAHAARELHRLERLRPDGVVREYLRYRREHPEECSGLVRIGRIWDRICRAAVKVVLARIEREQREAAQDAA